MVLGMQDDEVISRDSGAVAMWMAIAMPVIMILCLVLIAWLWAKTGLLVALVVFAGLCSVAAAAAARWRVHTRGF
jgi:membrane-anchored protein YejM (alkaline phosphatase superfamily)